MKTLSCMPVPEIASVKNSCKTPVSGITKQTFSSVLEVINSGENSGEQSGVNKTAQESCKKSPKDTVKAPGDPGTSALPDQAAAQDLIMSVQASGIYETQIYNPAHEKSTFQE